ncbi:MAG: Cys-Gln thioester bond-forming surface protein [Anaerolineae bacterium]|nr:Cys-Gln thioester bond-forming surface protein [Anaerolineae bacterium]
MRRFTLTFRFIAALAFVVLLLSLSGGHVAAWAGDGGDEAGIEPQPMLPAGEITTDTPTGSSIARATAIGKGVYIQHPDIDDGEFVYAGTILGTVDGQPAKFYCIDIHHFLAFNQDYRDDGNTPAEITYILNNYYPYATSSGALSDEKQEATAVQLAIWHFSDGIDLGDLGPHFRYSKSGTDYDATPIKNRAQAIVDDATANAGTTTPVQTLEIQFTSQDETTATFIVVARDEAGNGVSGITVHLSATNGTLSATTATTGSDGQTEAITITRGRLGESWACDATIVAEATVTIPQGTRYVHVNYPDGKQKLVLATPTCGTRHTERQIGWWDFGDAPEGELGGINYSYPTTSQNDGARHCIIPGVYLGSAVDVDNDGHPTGDADGDDNDDAYSADYDHYPPNDEDGVVFPSNGLIRGQENCIDVTASVDGYLNAWIDFNGDGDWNDANEHVLADQPLSAGTNHICFSVPSDATTEKRVYARFRFSQNNPIGQLSYSGYWCNGEVEDYWVAVGTPTAVTLSSLSASARPAQPWGAAAVVVMGIALVGGLGRMMKSRRR